MLVVTSACATSVNQKPQFGAHPLSELEMDRVTAGSAHATSTASAQASGTGAIASSLAGAVSTATGSPITGVPFLSYASLQGQASGAQAKSAQVDAAGEIAVSSGTTAGVKADITAAAGATGPGVRAQVNIQFYAAVTTNQTTLMFGTVDALGCCTRPASDQAVVSTVVEGPHVAGQQTRRTGTIPGANESGIDISEASSRLPVIDPAQLAAAWASRLAPRY